MSYGLRMLVGGKKPIVISDVSYGTSLFFGRPQRPDPFNQRLFCQFDWSGFSKDTAKISIHSGADRFNWSGNVNIVDGGLWLEGPIEYATDNDTTNGLPWCTIMVTALPSPTGDTYGLRILNSRNVNPILLPTRCIQTLSYSTVIQGGVSDFDIPGVIDSDIVFVGAGIEGGSFSCIRGMSRYEKNHLHFVGDTNGVRILAFRNIGAAHVGGYGIRIVNKSGIVSISNSQPPLLIKDTFNNYTHAFPYKAGFTPSITGTAGWYSGRYWRKSTRGIFSAATENGSSIWDGEHWREDAVYADGNYQCRSAINFIDMDMYPERFGGG